MNIRQLEIELDNAWWGHGDTEYEYKLSAIKMMGYKVYRNSDGKHKVVQNTEPNNFADIFYSMFGGNNRNG